LTLGRGFSNPLRSRLWDSLRRWLLVGMASIIALVSLPTAPVQAQSAATAAIGSESFVARAVRRVGPAVVRIDTEKTVTRQSSDPFMDDPFLRDFFGGFPRQPQEERLRGQGSGFIMDDTGNILTNAHVVNGADRVVVTLKDGRSFDAIVEGVDEVTDLAVVKIDDTDDDELPVATLGDSDQIQVGDWAIAVGNPLGLDNTVTLGIISTLKRSSNAVGIPGKRVDFIQTDAAINPGNSGGPLLNLNGEVIGVNTAIIQGAQGLGFSIPINTVQRISSQLIQTGRVEHAYLGIQMVSLSPEVKENINRDPNRPFTVQDEEGVLIARVMPNSPAAQAGLRDGDVIVAIEGQSVKDGSEVQRVVEQSTVGQNLSLTLRRNGQEETLNVRPGNMPSQS